MTKAEIRQALTSKRDTYCIETVMRGCIYKVRYYSGFCIDDISHSLLASHIKHWMVNSRTFIVI